MAIAWLVVGSVSCVTMHPADAQDNDWQHTFAIYLMGTGMDGTAGVGPLDADVNMSFNDILDHLELGVMTAYAGNRDPWAIAIDAIYTELEARRDVTAQLSFEAEVKQALVSVDAAYRLTEHLEVLAGLRYNDLQLDVAVVNPAGEQLAGASESWVDPYVGARFGISLGQRWTFVLRGDVGGFDVGAELAWQLLSRFGWQATERVDAFFGYRVLDVDYEDGNGAGRFSYDVRSSGPLAGVAWRF